MAKTATVVTKTKTATKADNNKTRTKKEDIVDTADKPKREPTAYQVFCKEHMKKWNGENPGHAKEAMTQIAAMWKESPENPNRGQDAKPRKPKSPKEPKAPKAPKNPNPKPRRRWNQKKRTTKSPVTRLAATRRKIERLE